VVCLPIPSLLSPHHPLPQHAQAIQTAYFNHGYVIRTFEFVINFSINSYSPATNSLCWPIYIYAHTVIPRLRSDPAKEFFG
jgi:hypothetical protein